VRHGLEELAVVGVSSTPAELTAYLKSELEQWGLVIKDANIEPHLTLKKLRWRLRFWDEGVLNEFAEALRLAGLPD
jgi:hypothetical protein